MSLFASHPFGAGGQQARDLLAPMTKQLLANAAAQHYTGVLTIPGAESYQLQDGNVVARKDLGQTWKNFAIEAGALVGGGIVAGGGLATGAGTGGGVGVGETGATTGLSGPVAGLGVTAPPAVAPAVGAGIGSSLWKTIATAAIPAAANLVGAKVESSANDKAAQITADQADRALAQAKEIYDTNRNDLAPYRQEGVSSLALLNSHLGLPAPTQTPSAPTQTLASLGQQPATTTDAEPMVNMLSPQGQPGQVPQSKVQQALAAGGKLVTQ